MPRPLASCRRGAVSVIFAIATIPILGFCGLAVDYGVWSEVNANLETAVNVAALNAVKIAANGYINHDANYIAEGQTAGSAWFYAIEQSMRPQAVGGTIAIAITGNASITATATYSGASIPRIIGKIFGTTNYFLTVQAAATINTATYLEVVMMLDNSSSMDIAATVSGINQLMTLSACDATNAYYDNPAPPYQPDKNKWTDASHEVYSNYQYVTNTGTTFDGSTAAGLTLNPPVNGQTPVGPYPAFVANEYPTGVLTAVNNKATFSEEFYDATNFATSWNTNQTCQGVLPKQADGNYPIPGAPCAFACHWTNQAVQPPPGAPTNTPDPRGSTNDLWGLARRNNIPLRFDLVKNATNTTLKEMANSTNTGVSNLSVGVYTFDSAVHQVYPAGCAPLSPGCEAGTDFGAAEGAVGLPPKYPSVTDTGIQPILAGFGLNGTSNDNTAFPENMNALARNYVTAAGDGTTAAAPRKVLFLITDGFQDDPFRVNDGLNDEREAFDPSYCKQFKDMGYQVYVVYTPYYPVPHFAYLLFDWAQFVQQTGPSSITARLQACSSQSNSSGGTYYISAANQNQLNTALLTFLQQALKSPARYTQ
jgi:Flp pilus assembly protein TadG